MVKRNKYHIQLKRTRLYLNDSEDPTLQQYGLVFGEPVYLNQEKRLVMGPTPATGRSTPIPDCHAIKLVSQNLPDPDDPENSDKNVCVVEQGVHFKNLDTESRIANLTDHDAYTIYPITKMAAIETDTAYSLEEFLLRKVNIDKSTLVRYPSLGVESVNGNYEVYVDEFQPEISDTLSSSLTDIVNKKVSIDDGSAVTVDVSLGRDLFGVYVRIPGEDADELDYIKSYIDMVLDKYMGIRFLALEGSVYYLQDMINNLNYVHVGSTPPTDTKRLWIDTTVLTGGLKYCSNKNTSTWSHVPVAYT